MLRSLSYIFLISTMCCYSLLALSQPIKIHLLQPEITLEYAEAARFSQVLTDAQSQIDYPIYALGLSLISPNKQTLIEQKKSLILKALSDIDSAESTHIAEQLKSLHFAYREKIETRLQQVRTIKKNNPLLTHDYTLSIPTRPNFIRLITPKQTPTPLVKQLPNARLKDYMTPDIAGDNYDSAWIIQADQSIQHISGIQWQGQNHYLSPGSIIFVGLDNVPDQYQHLNQDIAQLLTQHLEL
ncbi:hypothetical protein EBI01_19980 [Marinomonas rhizomae]|uniref:Capsule biosynthesis protein GfcC n=1 Tax=Marinomonas rhizomae TaxID=491948 RepID=A0A366J8U0_9GAMM|nr:capsule biosynthesis GfcC family protein [Marinomonas rhizomae]RBP83297.1 capsule biosynthesis protein GfcC [Marinomonas rhizomae]RNF68714.1 hypothetical protein EBI01_19980 [Marinomonas rhizomae]